MPFPGKPLPDGCDPDVVAAVLQLANMVANGGITVQGTKLLKIAAKGMLFVLGVAEQLLDGSLGQCGAHSLNRFLKMPLTVFDVLADPDALEELLPCFAMDKAMVLCGKTGRILGNKFGIASIEEGDKSAGTKLQAASAIAQKKCVAIKVSEDICEPGGDAGGMMQLFPGTKEYIPVPKVGRGGVWSVGRGGAASRSLALGRDASLTLLSPPTPAPSATRRSRPRWQATTT